MSRESNCLIVCSQPLTGVPGHVAEVVQDAYTIAVDGGLAHFRLLKLKPDLWVGDGDSADKRDLAKLKCKKKRLPRAKDYTDLEYALHLAGKAFLEGEWEGNIVLVGAQGGRFDHDVTNMLVAQQFLQDLVLAVGPEQCPGVVSYGEHGMWIAAMGELSFHQGKRKLFSVMAFGRGPKLTISGAKYTLRNAHLDHASMGLSNEGLGRNVRISAQHPRGEACQPYFVVFQH